VNVLWTDESGLVVQIKIAALNLLRESRQRQKKIAENKVMMEPAGGAVWASRGLEYSSRVTHQ
jgi:hypothetical protein